MTFAKACGHFSGFTSAHESRDKDLKPTYPDYHIESCWHAIWKLDWLTGRYPDALFVYLRRNKHDVINSWIQRPRLDMLADGMMRKQLKTEKERLAFAHYWYAFVTSLIHNYFDNTAMKYRFMVLEVPPTFDGWKELCNRLVVSRDEIKPSFEEWETKHNATKAKGEKNGAGTD